jgi:O-antigen/teichoic acid export membrane protein
MAVYYDAYHVGLYSVGMQVASYMFTLPEAAGFVIWPKILEAWGAFGDPEKMRRHIELPTVTAAFVMPFLAGLVHTSLPAAIYLIVPEFAGSVNAAQILTWAGVFLALPLAANSLLVASNREVEAVAVRAGSGLLLGAVTWWMVMHQAHITHIAYAAAGAYAVASLASLLLVLPHYYKGRELISELAACYLPTVWAVAALRMGSKLAANLMLPAEGDILWSLLQMGFFVLIYAPGVVYAHYHIDLLNEIRAYIGSRRRALEEFAVSQLEDEDK